MKTLLAGAGLFLTAAAGGFWMAPRSDLQRGAYLVHQVAHCAACHTPRDDNGNPRPDQLLKGAPVPVAAPPYPRWAWAPRAPALAGLPGWSDEEAVDFLKTGIVPRTGRTPRPPMPPFRFNDEDARAVVAYLRSLR
jgi:mono/diheme cytochrome c family protein